MSLKYTTVEAIGRKLKGRLSTGGAVNPFGSTVVDSELLQQVGEQVEAQVDAKLRGVYRLPLIGVHPVLAKVVEDGVICDLMATHFVGDGNNEPGGFGRWHCTQFQQGLNDILSGAVPLDGETLSTGEADLPPSRNVSRAALRKPGDAEKVVW